MLRGVSVFVVLFVLTVSSVVHGDTRFTFPIPEGWTDVTAEPGALARAWPELVAAVESGQYVKVAADLRDGPTAGCSMLVVVRPQRLAVTERVVDDIAAVMIKAIGEKGVTAEILEKSQTELNGIRVGHFVARLVHDGEEEMRVAHLIPGKNEHALIVFVSPSEAFAAAQPVFEDTARHVTGGENTKSRAEQFKWPMIFFLLAGLSMMLRNRAQRRREEREGREATADADDWESEDADENDEDDWEDDDEDGEGEK